MISVIAQTPVPPPPSQRTQGDWLEWGLAIGVLILVGKELLAMYRKSEEKEDKAMELYQSDAREREKLLLERVLQESRQQNTKLVDANTTYTEKMMGLLDKYITQFDEHLELTTKQTQDIEEIRSRIEELKSYVHFELEGRE